MVPTKESLPFKRTSPQVLGKPACRSINLSPQCTLGGYGYSSTSMTDEPLRMSVFGSPAIWIGAVMDALVTT
jgi:hypothetical protein